MSAVPILTKVVDLLDRQVPIDGHEQVHERRGDRRDVEENLDQPHREVQLVVVDGHQEHGGHRDRAVEHDRHRQRDERLVSIAVDAARRSILSLMVLLSTTTVDVARAIAAAATAAAAAFWPWAIADTVHHQRDDHKQIQHQRHQGGAEDEYGEEETIRLDEHLLRCNRVARVVRMAMVDTGLGDLREGSISGVHPAREVRGLSTFAWKQPQQT